MDIIEQQTLHLPPTEETSSSAATNATAKENGTK
jgi:hypothetical protein